VQPAEFITGILVENLTSFAIECGSVFSYEDISYEERRVVSNYEIIIRIKIRFKESGNIEKIGIAKRVSDSLIYQAVDIQSIYEHIAKEIVYQTKQVTKDICQKHL
jgi:hypothetical protein